jgi:5'-methylthioadenosine phosphorylase
MAIGIIGGTGFYEIAHEYFKANNVSTEYGDANVFIGHGEWENFVFIPRHGVEHNLAPHSINYQANIKALKQLGVDRIGGTFVVGSLDKKYPPGAIVVLDQFIDLTHGRADTFFDVRTEGTLYTDLAYPFCPELRQRLQSFRTSTEVQIINKGCYVAINGPRFATVAEIRMQQAFGGHIAGMTCVPEVVLARELGIHYVGIAIITAFEAGIQSDFADTSQITSIMTSAKPTVITMLKAALYPKVSDDCICSHSQL